MASSLQSVVRVYGSLFCESSLGGVLEFLAFREHNSTVSITECSEKSTRGLRDRLRMEIPTSGSYVIHTMDVDTRDTRPNGRDRAEDEALSERSHRCGMGADRAAADRKSVA